VERRQQDSPPSSTPVERARPKVEKKKEPAERRVRLQVYVPESLYLKVQEEVHRRVVSGRRSKGDGDQTGVVTDVLRSYFSKRTQCSATPSAPVD
jgi:hypothetical protein